MKNARLRSPVRLRCFADIKAKLARHRTTHPLFDLARYRTAIEAAYATMWARNEAGLPPAAFDVAPGGAVEVRE